MSHEKVQPMSDTEFAEIEAMVDGAIAQARATGKSSEYVVTVTARRSTLAAAQATALAVLDGVPFYVEVSVTEFVDGYPVASHGPKDYNAPKCAGTHGGRILRCCDRLGCGLPGCPSLPE